MVEIKKIIEDNETNMSGIAGPVTRDNGINKIIKILNKSK